MAQMKGSEIACGSQELLEAVEHERSTRHNRAQTTTIFHHPAFGDSDLQHVGAPVK